MASTEITYETNDPRELVSKLRDLARVTPELQHQIAHRQSANVIQSLLDGIEGLTDSLDDAVIADEAERLRVHEALIELLQNGGN